MSSTSWSGCLETMAQHHVPLPPGVSWNHDGNGISDYSDDSTTSSSSSMEPFQVHDIHGDNEMDETKAASDLEDDDDPALVAVREQVQRIDEWLEKVIQPIVLQTDSERQQQDQQRKQGEVVKRYDYDDNDSDDDGVQEECFALHYYSERKLRHDLHRVDLILRPALSLSRPSEEMHHLDDDFHALESTSLSSFLDDMVEGWRRKSWQQPMLPQHRSAPVPPTPILPSGQSQNNWNLHDERLLYGPVVQSQPTVSNLSFDSSTVTLPKATSISSSSTSPTKPCPDIIVSSTWSSNHSLPDHLLKNHESNNGLPSLTMADSNSSILSAITRETSTSDSKSYPWSGIVTPSPPSHHGERQMDGPMYSPLALQNTTSSSSSSFSSISNNKSKRNIFLENLHIQLRDIDSLLQADSSNSSFPANDDDDDVTPDEILDELECNLGVYRDLDTIKTQLLHAKAATTTAAGYDKASHPTSGGVNARRNHGSSPKVIGVNPHHHHHHNITPPNVPSPLPQSQPPPPPNHSFNGESKPQHQDKYFHNYHDPANVNNGKFGKDVTGISFASPTTLYPEDGETEPTARSSLSLESSQDPNDQEGGLHDDNMILAKTFPKATSAMNIHPVKDHDNMSAAKWNEIGNLISNNIQECANKKSRGMLERHTRHAAPAPAITTSTTTTRGSPRVDQPESFNVNTKEDQDSIVHALARIYARMYLKPVPAQQNDPQKDHHHDHPLRGNEKHIPIDEAKVSSCHPTLPPDKMIDDRDIEEAIYRISLRVQLGALRLVEERRQLSESERTWQKQMLDHMTQHTDTKEEQDEDDKVDAMNHYSNDEWFGQLIASSEWRT